MLINTAVGDTFAAPSAGAPNAAALGWLFFVCGTGTHGPCRCAQFAGNCRPKGRHYDGSLIASLAWRGVGDRECRWSKQSKAARGRQRTKRGADLLREDQAWSERHGSEQQTSATCFAAPSFFVCGTGTHGRPCRCKQFAGNCRPKGRHYGGSGASGAAAMVAVDLTSGARCAR